MPEKNISLQEINARITLVLWCILCFLSMLCMLYAASHKSIILTDKAGERISISPEAEDSIRAYSAQKLEFVEEAEKKGTIRVPVDKYVKAEDIKIDNRYTEKQLRIYVKGGDYRFYLENAVSGDLSGIIGGECLSQNEGVVLIIHLAEVFEYDTTMNDGELVIGRMKMSDAYAKVVVIDPAGGGEEAGSTWNGISEKEIALNVAIYLSEKIDLPDVKVLITRFSDVNLSEEERIAFVNDTGADLYLGIGLYASENSTDYGINGIYNEEYFIPEFGNLEFTDILLRDTAFAVNNRANGLTAVAEESILKKLTIPAAQIQIGNLSNEKERNLLIQTEYQNMLAEGFSNAIMEACEKISENE